MGILMNRSLAVVAGVICATVGGVVVVSAAGTPSSSASSSASGAALRPLHAPRLAGAVFSDSSSGGALGQGQLVVTEPDGTKVTLSLASRTKAWKYQGLGVKLISESPADLSAGEIVAAAVRTLHGDHVAVRILDLGFQAAP